MDSKNILCYLAFFVLALSTVTALNCISCSEYTNGTVDVKSDEVTCHSRKEGPGIPCESGEVCSTIYNPNTTLLTRNCESKDICKNIAQNCSTCSTDLCGNSGYQMNPVFVSIFAGLLFASLGR